MDTARDGRFHKQNRLLDLGCHAGGSQEYTETLALGERGYAML